MVESSSQLLPYRFLVEPGLRDQINQLSLEILDAHAHRSDASGPHTFDVSSDLFDDGGNQVKSAANDNLFATTRNVQLAISQRRVHARQAGSPAWHRFERICAPGLSPGPRSGWQRLQ